MLLQPTSLILTPTSTYLVGKKGLEPLWIAPPVPKTGACTNSATCPIFELICKCLVNFNRSKLPTSYYTNK